MSEKFQEISGGSPVSVGRFRVSSAGSGKFWCPGCGKALDSERVQIVREMSSKASESIPMCAPCVERMITTVSNETRNAVRQAKRAQRENAEFLRQLERDAQAQLPVEAEVVDQA